ncbi:hypothetical protein ACLB2K_060765 [Fragaria x ananassa]
MPSLARSSNLHFLILKNVAIEEEFGKWISECCKSIKSPEVLSSVSRGRVLTVTGDIIKSSGFNISYWKSLNLAFVDHLQYASITIFNGDNEVEFAAYLLENARNLKEMVIYHSAKSAIR